MIDNPAEINYSTTEQELFGVTKAIQNLREYSMINKLEFKTDRKAQRICLNQGI